MIRTTVGIVLLIAAVVWLPVWLQIGLFVLGVIVLRYQVALLVPAIVADVLYAPDAHISFHHMTMTLIVGVLLLISRIIRTQTRLSS